ncbi:hypothetical protein [Kitasatospora griseola]|uniref:hypothetical protein n=1 Tax=Kitasatospora griseola TaxID=2064 RepID=UPI0016709152|nr:hypothetical protein [Kitasatospora griseola]GGR00972.1 hypothetical protein GCM10010195_66030 [Kitasatospora griseola]
MVIGTTTIGPLIGEPQESTIMSVIQPRYATDITVADVNAAILFLHPWLESELDTRNGTPGARFADALDVLVHDAATRIRLQLDHVASRPDVLSEADRLNHLTAVRDDWNLIAAALRPWRHVPGFDRARFRPVRHLSAAHEVEDPGRGAVNRTA